MNKQDNELAHLKAEVAGLRFSSFFVNKTLLRAYGFLIL
jgi:hypothetical protein